MNTTRRVFSGWVAGRNTPETDAMPQVLHHVSVHFTTDDGAQLSETVELFAKHPQDAMDKVKAMSDTAYGRLKRVQ
jgi:hypothetical protein